MMIKITEHCSMGCTHCMNNATPNNKHMDFDTFQKAVKFQKKYGGPVCIVTGGEPAEHPTFVHFLTYIVNELIDNFITITTNGIWMQDNFDFIYTMNNIYGTRLMFQVTNDKKYYPIRLNLTHPVFQLDNVIVCDNVEHIYPQGRALDNNLKWSSKGSKCFNVRALTHQISDVSLNKVIVSLAMRGKFCTPHIAIDGHIKLGESDLCPNCSHINKSESNIINDIMNFKCSGCNHINKQLPEMYRKIIGEV